MTNGTRVHEDDYLRTSLLYKFLNLRKNKILGSWVRPTSDRREGGVQFPTGDFIEDSICGEFKIHGPSLACYGEPTKRFYTAM
jgi:hypothetical protein